MEFEPRIIESIDKKTVQKSMRIGCGLFLLLGLVVGFLSILGPYTDYLWYSQDAGHPEVFTVALTTRAVLFLIGFVLAFVVLAFNLGRALKVSLVYLRGPQSVAEEMIFRVFDFLLDKGRRITKLIALVIAVFFGLSLAGHWSNFLAWQHGQPFGIADPIFGRDYSFFVFSLPWWQAVLNVLTFLALLTTLAVVGIYVGLQSLAALAKIELGRPAIRAHISILGGITLILFAGQLWIRRYDYGLVDSGVFTGAGHAATVQLGAQTILAILVALVGVVALLNARLWQPFRPTITAAVIAAVFGVIGIMMVPSGVQRFRVEPNKITVEGPYAERAISATRYAYALDRIDVRQSNVQDVPSAEDLQGAQPTLANMRLWDPEVLRRGLEHLQALRPYYRFPDVDIDRYQINGQQQMVMVAARDIDTNGLSPNARTWVNTRLQYTHGFGITMSPVNTSTQSGQPTFLIKDFPPQTPPEVPIAQPRIYFSDFRARHGTNNNYVIVNTQIDEFDFPSEGQEDRFYRWTGNRGVRVGSFLPKLAYSIRLGDGNLLVTPNVTAESRLLYRRGIIERASLIYPFLRFDNDPYIVVFNGRLVWIMDAYTTTGRIPYSAMLGDRTLGVNYIRNSVKVVVDAYTGDTEAYAIEPDEPILKTYRQIYPRLIKDLSELPAGLERHFRYPEDMFVLQSAQLTQYHVTEPRMFLNNEDAWEIPMERSIAGGASRMRPYYVQMKVPGDERDRFLLILPFTPRERKNMSGWMAAHCDPERYGEVVLFKFPRDRHLPGPEQKESIFNQDSEIARINREFNNEQSRIVVGNLLVVPVGNSVIYVEPLFLESRAPGSPAIPELKKVIVAMKDRVVVADTYQAALQRLFGDMAAPVTAALPPPVVEGEAVPPGQPVETAQPPPIGAAVTRDDVREALRLAEQADTALREGDFARYGELQRRLRDRLREMSGD
jgi:uncharacterized protein